MSLALSILVLLEIMAALLAATTFFRTRGFSPPEAFSYAFVVVVSFYSASIQAFFLLHISNFYYLVDCVVVAAAASVLLSNAAQVGRLCRDTVRGAAALGAFIIPFLLLYLYLLGQVLMLPPSSEDSMIYNLARVLMMQREGTLFPVNGSSLRQVSFPIGWDIIHFLFLRFYSDYFLRIFGFLSYTAIIAATYSLAENAFHNRKLSFTTAIIVCSLIEIVLQSTSTKNDLPVASLAAVSLLAAHKFLRGGNGYNLLLLATSLLLAAASKGYSLAFIVPFVILYSILLWRTHSPAQLRDCLRPFGRYAALSILALAVLVCGACYGQRIFCRYGSVFGAPLPSFYQHDGLQGAGFNALRYAVQAADLPARLGGRCIERLNDMIQERTPRSGALREQYVIGPSGRQQSPLRWGRIEEISWFGPLGFFIVLPAVFFCLVRGDSFQRLTALALLMFCFAICYKMAWTPTNSRFFSIFFAASGQCVAFFLNKAVSRKHFKYLILLSLFIFAYAAFSNQRQPLIDVPRLADRLRQRGERTEVGGERARREYLSPGPLVLNWLPFALDRDAYFDEEFARKGVMAYFYEIEAGGRVMIIGGEDSWIYPFLIRRPDLHVTVTDGNNFRRNGALLDLTDKDQLSSVAGDYDYIIIVEKPPPASLDDGRLLVNWKNHLLIYDYR